MRKYLIIILMVVCTGLTADFNFAVELFEDGLYEEAISEFQTIAQLYPTSYEAERSILYIGRSYRGLNDPELAESTFQKLLDAYPGNSFQDEIYAELASVQYEQKKFKEAELNFAYLIRNFPLSEFSKQSLVDYLDCFYQQELYNLVIEKGEQIQKDYKNSKKTADILLIMVKAYLKLNSHQEAKFLMDRIQSEFPTENAVWEIILIETDQFITEGKYNQAGIRLKDTLNKNIPRNYEEIFRLKLTEILLGEAQYNAAADQLNILIDKFNNSSRFDEFILYLNKANLGMEKYDLAAMPSENPRVIENSSLYPEYMLTRAEAYFQLQKLEEAAEIVEQILNISQQDQVFYQAGMLNARIDEKAGRWVRALEAYDTLTGSEYAARDELWLRIGNIYSNKLSNYNKAIKYYNNVIYGIFPLDVQYRALYLLAGCHERLADYDNAIDALNRIDVDEITDLDFRNRIKLKLNFLKKYKHQQYDSAFKQLLTAVYNYLDTDNKVQLKSEIVNILSSDLKEYELSNQLLTDSVDQHDIYLKALINLNLAEKVKFMNDNEKAQAYLDSALELASQLEVAGYEEEIREISLREQIIKGADNDGIIANLENFITKYPASSARNEFLLLIIDHYRDKDNREKLVQLIGQLELSGKIDPQLYYKNKIWLAEYYYNRDEDEKARQNYELGRNLH